MTKDVKCMVHCMGRTEETAYHCYSLCDTAGIAFGKVTPEQPSNNNSQKDKKTRKRFDSESETCYTHHLIGN